MAFGSNKRPDDTDYNTLGATGLASSSFFGKTMKIDGEITSDDDVTIEGNINGQVKVSKTVTIGNDGYVNGTISASVVRIAGEAEGHINASKKVEISSQGKYSGSIQSDVIVVAEGAKLKGTINYEEESAAPKKSPAKPAKKEEPRGKPEEITKDSDTPADNANTEVTAKPEKTDKTDPSIIDVKASEVSEKKPEEKTEGESKDQ